MAWYNWLIVIIPFVFVIGIALYSRRYIRDVVDFLAAGRICGRYVISVAGMISLVVTDAIQAIMCYPIFLIMVVFIVILFSWFDEIVPALTNRVPGESFLNPYDVSELRDFNLFALFVMLFPSVLNRGTWCGGGSDTAARTAHEGKMATMFFIADIISPCIVGSITTVWFMWGGIRDIRQLFRDLAKRKADPTDNGMVRNDS